MPVPALPRFAVAMVLAAAALATAAQDTGGIYAGASGGIAKAILNPSAETQRLQGLGLGNPQVATDERGHAAKAFVGVGVLPWLSVEAGVFSLRTFELNSDVTGGQSRAEAYLYGFNVDAVVGWQVAQRTRVFGRLGLLNARSKTETAVSGTFPPVSPTVKHVDLQWKVGAGVEYRLSSAVALRVEWERYHIPVTGIRLDNVDALSAGFTYTF